MIFFDVTKSGAAGHRSGLTRVNQRLLTELGSAATPVRWSEWQGRMTASDWFLTTEVFALEERPGFDAFLAANAARCAAVFHDAIPLKHPTITWPQSVARHPGYMKMLASFGRVWAVSAASGEELSGFWRWQGRSKTPPVDVLTLGADFVATPRTAVGVASSASSLVCVGIVEPRKNQTLLLDVATDLWREGLTFDLHIVGRVNPHFGGPIVARMKSVRREFRGLHFHEAANDTVMDELCATARATVCPTIAEGCGLPLLESLWRGVPCICSDLPSLRENASGGGCVIVPVNDRAAWTAALRKILTDDAAHAGLAREATTRPLPTWSDAAATIQVALNPLMTRAV